MTRPRIVILAFSPIQRDARVLRQARYLARRYDVTVFGQVEAPFDIAAGARVLPVPAPARAPWTRRAGSLLRLVAGRLRPGAYEDLYWGYPLFQETLAELTRAPADVFLGNDWPALPIVARAAAGRGLPFVLDLHEYAPGQFDNRRLWRWFRAPMIDHVLRRYGPGAAATMTVNEALAELYRRNYGFDPLVVMSAPAPVALPPFQACAPDVVRIVHHGIAVPERRIEDMIVAVARAQPRFQLDLLLIGQPPDYVARLGELARALAPDRVRILPPVAPDDIVPTIAAYDVGMFVLPPTTLNHAHALPNKLFDFIAAGLACCIGPSPEMARLVRAHDCGLVTADFHPATVAAALDAWTPAEIDRLKHNARQAAGQLNADVELGKVLDLFADLVPAAAVPR